MNTIKPKALPVLYVSHAGPPSFFDPSSDLHKRLKFMKETIIQPLKEEIKCIIFMSAHFMSQGVTKIVNLKDLQTIHDHGFDDYYGFRYSPRGHPEMAQKVFDTLKTNGIKVQLIDNWGADHGLWQVLAGLYENPKDVNVVSISVDLRAGEENIAKIGRILSDYRSQGCLIIGSGSISHNLGLVFRGVGSKNDAALVKTKEFVDWTSNIILNQSGEQRTCKILEFRKHSYYTLSHPSDDHWLPIIFACGAGEKSKATQIYDGQDMPLLYGNSFVFQD